MQSVLLLIGYQDSSIVRLTIIKRRLEIIICTEREKLMQVATQQRIVLSRFMTEKYLNKWVLAYLRYYVIIKP